MQTVNYGTLPQTLYFVNTNHITDAIVRRIAQKIGPAQSLGNFLFCHLFRFLLINYNFTTDV